MKYIDLFLAVNAAGIAGSLLGGTHWSIASMLVCFSIFQMIDYARRPQ